LYDALVQRFDRNEVFLDIDVISPGEDFREAIQRTCSSCEILLAIIGKQWATIQDKNGKLRLENERDLVRIEIATALQKGLRVIPVLVGGAVMPDESILPSDVQPIVYRNAWDLTDKGFHHDTQLLIDAIKKIMNSSTQVSGLAPTRQKQNTLFPLYGIILGKTTVSEFGNSGERVEAKTESGFVYGHYYKMNGLKFWYDEKSEIVDSTYLTHYDNWPEPWVEIGFRKEISYDSCLFLLQRMGYSIKIEKEPCIEKFDGHDAFSAEINARILDPYYHRVKLTFDYSRGTKTNDASTLYSIGVSID